MGYSGPIDTLGAVRHDERNAEAVALSRLRWRTRLLGGFAVLLIVAGAAYGVRMFNDHIQFVSTDDAYVDAQLADIAPQIDGSIMAVAVSDTQSVRRGDLLVRLDPADAALAVDQAQANYDQALRHVQQYNANVSAAEANVDGRQADMARAKLGYDRRAGLVETGAVSREELTAARNALDNAKSALSMSQQALAAQRVFVAETDASQNPEVRAAKAALDHARLDLSRTEIRAPVDGIVAQSKAQIGQRVHVGLPIMNVVPVHQAYVNANFKEVQLDRIKPGQKVSLTSDLYGSGVVFHGTVAGVGGGTGAAFAVIPAQNATGNWIKVVQRLPVRIALDPGELAKRPLRVGLSMTATIDLVASAPVAPRKAVAKAKPPVKAAKLVRPKITLANFILDPMVPAPVTPQVQSSQSAPVKPSVATAMTQPTPQVPLLRTAVSY